MISEITEKILDYSNTIIYKITCRDPSITNIYIGHTTNFCKRQKTHKYNSESENSPCYNCKLYETIRKNGGWNNWRMDIVNFFDCANKYEAMQKETEYFVLFNADLNSMVPCSDKTINNLPDTHIIYQSATDKNENSHFKFSCNNCNYFTNRKSQYDRHLNTEKHKINHIVKKYKLNTTNYYTCICGKFYKYDSGYYRHKKKCDKSKISTDDSNFNIKEILTEILENVKIQKNVSCD
jgi:hypothetical protein